jgi:glycosyltransferase involved in cell wall biosynthesis
MDKPPDVRRPVVCHVNLARGFRGGERQTELLIRELARQDICQRLVARRGEPLAGRLRCVDRLDVVGTGAGPVSGALAIGAADIVHVHEGRSLRSAWINSAVTGTPYVVTRRVQKGPRSHVLNRRMYRRASAIAVLSRAIGKSVSSLCPELVPTVIPSAVSGLPSSPERAERLRQSWGGSFVVGHVGVLDDSHKGQMQILDLAAGLAESLPDARFVLVGGGPDEAQLRSAAAGLANVVFAGPVEAVGDYLRAFDVFLFPSRHEGLGSILLDALDFGIPVVATRVGGIPEIVEDSVNGMLVDVGHIEGMRDALRALYSDSDLRARVGAAGRRTAEAHTASVMAERYWALYRSVLGEEGVGTT